MSNIPLLFTPTGIRPPFIYAISNTGFGLYKIVHDGGDYLYLLSVIPTSSFDSYYKFNLKTGVKSQISKPVSNFAYDITYTNDIWATGHDGATNNLYKQTASIQNTSNLNSWKLIEGRIGNSYLYTYAKGGPIIIPPYWGPSTIQRETCVHPTGMVTKLPGIGTTPAAECYAICATSTDGYFMFDDGAAKYFVSWGTGGSTTFLTIPTNTIYAMAWDGSDYIYGIDSLGNVERYSISGDSWTSLGSCGITVASHLWKHDLFCYDGDLYVCGNGSVAKYDGSWATHNYDAGVNYRCGFIKDGIIFLGATNGNIYGYAAP